MGISVGTAVASGDKIGAAVGISVGTKVVGVSVGTRVVGVSVGAAVLVSVGVSVSTAVGVSVGVVSAVGATVGETTGVKKLLTVVMKLNVTGPWLSLKTMLLVWPPPPEPSCGSDVSLR